MPIIDHTVLKVNYDLIFESLHPLEVECIKEQDSILRIKLTWSEVRTRPGLLNRLNEHAKKVSKILWFQEGDPYKGSKPFKITWIGLENLIGGATGATTGPAIILIITSQKSDRIKKKWTLKLSSFFGYPVALIWEEDAQ